MRKLAAFTLVILAANSASAAVIVSYNLNSNFVPSVVDSDVFATNVGQGGGLSQFDINGNRLRSRDWEQTNLTTARTGNDYVTFTVTPDPGHSVDLDFLSFDDFVEGANSPTTFQVGITVNGTETLYSSMATGTGPNPNTISPLSLSNITDPLEVRIYAWGGGTTAQRRWFIDNITLDGSVNAIPEPSTFALIGLAGIAGLVFFSRRRAK